MASITAAPRHGSLQAIGKEKVGVDLITPPGTKRDDDSPLLNHLPGNPRARIELPQDASGSVRGRPFGLRSGTAGAGGRRVIPERSRRAQEMLSINSSRDIEIGIDILDIFISFQHLNHVMTRRATFSSVISMVFLGDHSIEGGFHLTPRPFQGLAHGIEVRR